MLKLNDVTKHYPKFHLESISFRLEPGYVMGLIGDNGAGKTTLIKLIMNLIRRDAGTIQIFGLDNIKNEVFIKDKIGFIYDENVFYPSMTLSAHAKILSKIYSEWNHEKYKELIRRLDLDESKKVSELSHGMVQRFMTATALSHNARLLIMDEPTAGLDPTARRDFLDLIYEEIQNGETAVLFSSHITTDLDRIADYVTMLKNGKMLFTRPTEELRDELRLIKTAPDRVTTEDRQLLAGYRETKVSFEALCDTQNIPRLSFTPQIEDMPTIEDIMYYYDRRES
ncbi:MAG: ABC transporter ATP-binding protein [Tissierellia bacterium]|nr:ABC transporter ATP-binding protein [Tissierellia bacterium]